MLLNFIWTSNENGYIIMHFKDFSKSSKYAEFHQTDFGNFSHLLNFQFTFIISNGNELLKLNQANLEYIEKFSRNKCEGGVCETIRINTINRKSDFLWFCFATKIQAGTIDMPSPPSCIIHNVNSISKDTLGTWPGSSYASGDFFHRTVIEEHGNLVYSAFYSMTSKNLHIALNEIPFTTSTVKNNLVAYLPKFFFKGQGDFVGSFQDDGSVYFIYHETDSTCGNQQQKTIQARIVELCLSDRGMKTEESQNLFVWSTKVDLICKWSKEGNINDNLPNVEMNVVSDFKWLSKSRILLVTFNDITKSQSTSAVCSYTASEIKDAFNSQMKDDVKKEYIKNPYVNICSQKNIQLMTDKEKTEIHLISKIYPKRKNLISSEALYYKEDGIITKISADEIINKNMTYIYLSLEENHLNSLVVLKHSLNEKKSCIEKKMIMEEKITLLEHSMIQEKIPVLYIGTEKRLGKIELNNCGSYTNRYNCILDPYCGWKNRLVCIYLITDDGQGTEVGPGTCTGIPEGIKKSREEYWSNCDVVKQSNVIQVGSKNLGSCRCLTKNGLIEKIGSCDIHGSWTQYSDWSECLPRCGQGTQVRTRSCTFPRPQGQGTNCQITESLEHRPCNNILPCKNESELSMKLYGSWSDWSSCSRTCGFSYKQRQRLCLATSKSQCTLSLNEKKVCSTSSSCQETHQSEWTNWIIDSNNQSRKRAKFIFIKKYTHLTNPEISFDIVKTQSKIDKCDNKDNSCRTKYMPLILKSTFTDWTSWSNCNSNCGIQSYTTRNRTCKFDENNSPCLGLSSEVKLCNLKPCKSYWSCWSKWETCTKKCETPSIQKRNRTCLLDSKSNGCNGVDIEERACSLIECTLHYSKWSRWSSCLLQSYRKRIRKCLPGKICAMPLVQTKQCLNSQQNLFQVKYSSVYMAVSGLIGLFLGIVLGITIGYIWQRCSVSVIKESESVRMSQMQNYYQAGDSVDQTSILYGSQYLRMASPPTGTLRQISFNNSGSMNDQNYPCPEYNPTEMDSGVYSSNMPPPQVHSPSAYNYYPSYSMDPQQGQYYLPPGQPYSKHSEVVPEEDSAHTQNN